jgi:hypothetical protein
MSKRRVSTSGVVKGDGAAAGEKEKMSTARVVKVGGAAAGEKEKNE